MTLAEDAANMLIGDFGEEVEITTMDDGEFDDPDDPIYHSSSETQGSTETHKVRLYTTPSKEKLERYGFDEDTKSLMYSTDDIAKQGDKVEYDIYDWVVGEKATNQIGHGPYIYIYQLMGE